MILFIGLMAIFCFFYKELMIFKMFDLKV